MTLLERYEHAMLQKRQAEAIINQIRGDVMIEIKKIAEQGKNGRYEYKGDKGNFFITKYKKYVFSDAVAEKTQELKDLKIKEMTENIAQVEESEMIIFKQPKDVRLELI